MTARRILRSAALGLLGLAAGAVVVEAGLRLIAATPLWPVLPVVEVSLYGPDDRAGYTHRPHVSGIWRSENRARISINAQGFRGPALSMPKPAGETRIVMVGDSITEALQVGDNETFAALTEARLRAAGGNVRVANFGLAGATPAVQRERIATRVAALQPDIVVLLPAFSDFFSTRAADDSAFPAWIATADGGLELRHGFRATAGYRFRSSRYGEAFYWLLDHVQLAGLLNNRKNAGLLPPPAVAAAVPVEACAEAEAYWRAFGDPAADIGWQRVARYMQDIAALGRNHGFASLLLMHGLALGADCAGAAPLRAAVLARLQALAVEAALPLQDLESLVAARLPAGTVPGALRGFGAHTGAGHLNRQGHAVYADILAATLAPR